MVEESAAKDLGPKKRLTKPQAITVMVVGGIMMVLPMLIATDQDSAAHMVKIGVGFVGFCVLCAGAYLRP